MNGMYPALQGQTILLVEDDPIAGMPLSTILRQYGNAASELVASIARAQARLGRAPRPGLLLIDHNLFDGIGTTLAVWVRQQPELQGVVQISYSARPPASIRATCPDPFPFDAMITKGDQSIEELIGRLDSIMREHATAGAIEAPR